LTAFLFCIMLTKEVVYILRKSIALALAIGFALCSHLRPNLDFTVGDELVKSGCSPAGEKAARQAALAAMEEILPGAATLPEYRRHIRLSFHPGTDCAPLLCDALLRSDSGVLAGSCVYVAGQRVGVVADSKNFEASFARYISNTLPTWASSGTVRKLELVPRYTRAEFEMGNEDMILLVTGLSPVMYTDGKGRVSPV
jgi:hypothetical protein